MSELATIPTNQNGARLPAMTPNRSLNMVQIMSDAPTFEQMQRAAKMFASSTLVPEHMRGNVANVMIAMSMAFTLGEDPLVVMQSIYFVGGKAGWAASYMIGRANKSGIFKGNIDWRETGEGDSLSVTAFATKADTGSEVSIDASMKMAIAEGWTRNSKYKSMPRLMLRYRAATLLIRLYAPEVMLGRTVEEIEDIRFSQADNDITIDVPTGQLHDLINAQDPIDPPETMAEQIGEQGLAEIVSEVIDDQKPREFPNFESFQIAVSEYGESKEIPADKIKAVLTWAKLSTDANKVGKAAKDARASIFNDIVAGKPVNGVSFNG